MQAWGVASFGLVRQNLDPLPIPCRVPSQDSKCHNLIPSFGELWREVSELAWKVLVDQEDLEWNGHS